MKSYLLILKGIKYYKRFNKNILLLFLIGIVSSIIFCIYFYGNFNPLKTYLIENKTKYDRRYDIIFETEIDEDELISFFNKSLSPYEIYFKTSSDNIFIENNISDSDFAELRYSLGCKAYDEQIIERKIRGRNYFTDEEIENAAHSVIISDHVTMNIRKSINYGTDKLTINGVEYTIIGEISTMSSDLMIPYTTYQKQGFETDYFTYYSTEKIPYYKNLEFLSSMNDEFGSSVHIRDHPYNWYEKEKSGTPIILIAMAILFAIVVLAFMFLLKFMADNTNYISVIYAICGATKETVIFIKLSTVFIITLVSSLIGIAIHILTYDVIFKYVNIVDNLTYDFNDYLQLAAIATLSSVILSIPFMFSFTRNSKIVSKNKFS